MKRLAFVLVVISIWSVTATESVAQCAMCRRNVESNQQAKENKVGSSLNSGILYLMSVPYVIGVIGIAMWMKNRKKEA